MGLTRGGLQLCPERFLHSPLFQVCDSYNFRRIVPSLRPIHYKPGRTGRTNKSTIYFVLNLVWMTSHVWRDSDAKMHAG